MNIVACIVVGILAGWLAERITGVRFTPFTRKCIEQV